MVPRFGRLATERLLIVQGRSLVVEVREILVGEVRTGGDPVGQARTLQQIVSYLADR